MRYFGFQILLLLLPLFASADIQFEGIRKEDESALYETYPQLKTKPSPALLDDAVRWLMLREIYANVDVLQNASGQYTLKGKIQRRLSKVQLVGIKNIDEIDALNAIKLREGQRLEQNQILESIQDLRELYGRSGYFNSEIRASVKESQIGEVIVLYEIKENNPCIINAISIETKNKKLLKELGRSSKGTIKKIFSEKNIADLELELNQIIQEGRYLGAKLVQKRADFNSEKTRATLIYSVAEPFSYFIQFSGNSEFTRSDILRTLDLDNYDRTSLNPITEISDKIRNKYLSEGYAHVKIRHKINENLSEYIKDVTYQIEEGSKIKIEKIEVVGRLSKPSSYYSEFIENNSSDAIDDHVYVKSDLELGYKNLITELNNQGLLQARIQSARAEFDEKRNRVKIIVLLEEGPLTTVSTVKFIGAKAFSHDRLIKELDLYPNAPLGLNHLEQGLEKIKALYKNSGFLEMVIENEDEQVVQYENKSTLASVNLKIREGPQVYVREILVEGNTFTKSYVVSRGSDIEIGELLTPDLIEEARQRLLNMRIFTQVEIKTLEANTNVSKRTIVITVTERSPGVFKIGMGLTNKRKITARGFSGISYDNLYGTGRAIALNVTAETSVAYSSYPLEYDASISYLEPFLLSSKFRGRVSLGQEKVVEDFDEDSSTSQLKITNRLSFFAERDITSKIKFTWNTYTLESVETYEDPKRTIEPSKEQIATVGPIFDVDYRDNPFAPTRGVFTRIEADYSSPDIASSEGIEFVRTQATFSFYNSFNSGKLVWANSVRGGYESNLSRDPSTGIPESYAFFLGGYTTIRGFSGIDGDRIPNKEFLPKDASDRIYIPNESTYYLVKSEFRFPIYGVIGAAVFYDAGQVLVNGLPSPYSETFSDHNPFRQAGGIGIRINTPVGPISIDYGRKFEHKSELSKDHLHVFIGAF